MKSLKIALILAVFCLALGNTSKTVETELSLDKQEIEAYKQQKQETILVAGVIKKNKKPGTDL